MFSPEYSKIIHYTGNENTQIYQVEILVTNLQGNVL